MYQKTKPKNIHVHTVNENILTIHGQDLATLVWIYSF